MSPDKKRKLTHAVAVAAGKDTIEFPGVSDPIEQYGYELHYGQTLSDFQLSQLPKLNVIHDDTFLNAEPEAVSFTQRRYLAARVTQGDDGRFPTNSELTHVGKVHAMVRLSQPPDNLTTTEVIPPGQETAAASSQPPTDGQQQADRGGAGPTSDAPSSSPHGSKEPLQQPAEADDVFGSPDSGKSGSITGGPLEVETTRKLARMGGAVHMVLQKRDHKAPPVGATVPLFSAAVLGIRRLKLSRHYMAQALVEGLARAADNAQLGSHRTVRLLLFNDQEMIAWGIKLTAACFEKLYKLSKKPGQPASGLLCKDVAAHVTQVDQTPIVYAGPFSLLPVDPKHVRVFLALTTPELRYHANIAAYIDDMQGVFDGRAQVCIADARRYGDEKLCKALDRTYDLGVLLGSLLRGDLPAASQDSQEPLADFVHKFLEAKAGGQMYAEAVLQYAADRNMQDVQLLMDVAVDPTGGAKMQETLETQYKLPDTWALLVVKGFRDASIVKMST